MSLNKIPAHSSLCADILREDEAMVSRIVFRWALVVSVLVFCQFADMFIRLYCITFQAKYVSKHVDSYILNSYGIPCINPYMNSCRDSYRDSYRNSFRYSYSHTRYIIRHPL